MRRLAGDREHPLSRGYVCPKGRKMARAGGRPRRPRRADDARRRREARPRRLGHRHRRPRRTRLPRSATVSARTPSACTPGRSSTAAGRFTRAGSCGDRLARASTRASTVDSIAEGPRAEADGGPGGPGAGGRLRAHHAAARHRREHGRLARRLLLLPRPHPVPAQRRASRGGVGARPPPHRDGAAGDPPPLAARSGTDFAVLAHLVRELLRDGADAEYLGPTPGTSTSSAGQSSASTSTPTVAAHRARAGDLDALLAAVRSASAPRDRHRHRRHHGGDGQRHRVDGLRAADRHRLVRTRRGTLVQSRGTPSLTVAEPRLPDSVRFGPGPKTHPEHPPASPTSTRAR